MESTLTIIKKSNRSGNLLNINSLEVRNLVLGSCFSSSGSFGKYFRVLYFTSLNFSSYFCLIVFFLNFISFFHFTYHDLLVLSS